VVVVVAVAKEPALRVVNLAIGQGNVPKLLLETKTLVSIVVKSVIWLKIVPVLKVSEIVIEMAGIPFLITVIVVPHEMNTEVVMMIIGVVLIEMITDVMVEMNIDVMAEMIIDVTLILTGIVVVQVMGVLDHVLRQADMLLVLDHFHLVDDLQYVLLDIGLLFVPEVLFVQFLLVRVTIVLLLQFVAVALLEQEVLLDDLLRILQ